MMRTSLICLENTHNRAGGAIYPLDEIERIRNFSKALGLKLHLDGARLWNASVASGISPKTYAQHFDTVSVCFSKGLGAPVGSALVGPDDTIERARKFRKIFGTPDIAVRRFSSQRFMYCADWAMNSSKTFCRSPAR